MQSWGKIGAAVLPRSRRSASYHPLTTRIELRAAGFEPDGGLRQNTNDGGGLGPRPPESFDFPCPVLCPLALCRTGPFRSVAAHAQHMEGNQLIEGQRQVQQKTEAASISILINPSPPSPF